MTSTPHQGLAAIWISLVSNVALTALKIAVGLLFASPVLVADGIHNAGDIIATLAALTSSMVSKKPADEDHPYGHGKAEVVASGIVALILAAAAVWIGYHSFESLLEPPRLTESWLPLAAAVVSLVVKQTLFLYTLRVGRAAKSKSVLATAYDHLADVYASAAAVAGIGLAVLGQRYDWTWAAYGDPVAGIVVSIFVLKLGLKMGREAIDILMEKNVPPAVIAEYERLIGSLEDIKRIDRVRAREHGHYIIVDVRVGVPSHYSIQQGHDISRTIKQRIMDHDPDVVEVMVHLNPWDADEEEKSRESR